MNIPTIETPRLVLRPFTPDDAASLNRLLHEPGILRHFPNATVPALPETERSIARRLEHWTQYGYGRWAVALPEDDFLVGWCGMDYFHEFDEPELTYLLSTRVWGRGYATEAARATVRFGFETAGLDPIMSTVGPDNPASIRVLEKCGLQLAERITVEGIPRLLYRITRSAYRSATAP